jgi:hypothetical protein
MSKKSKVKDEKDK